MARIAGILGGLLGMGLAGGLVVVALCRPLDQGPVYTVAQVQSQMAHGPGAWVGRTIRVRGRAMKCAIRIEHGYFRCLPLLLPRLSDPDGGAASEPLLLAWAAPDSLLTFARQLPLLGGALPAPQAVAWYAVATYRVQLRAMSGETCGATTCYEAALLDAAP